MLATSHWRSNLLKANANQDISVNELAFQAFVSSTLLTYRTNNFSVGYIIIEY